MSDVNISETQFQLPDGFSVYQKIWSPSVAPVARLVYFHGFSDHINNTFDLFPALAHRGIHCTGFDQRGWGRSAKSNQDRGNTGPTSAILADLAAFVEAQLAAQPSIPVFVMGHSMGGGLVATLASTSKYDELVSRLAGIILVAPFIGLHAEQKPHAISMAIGRLATRLFPRLQIARPIKAEHIVRDPAVQELLKNDPLNASVGTLEMYSNMLDRASDLASGKLKLRDKVRSVYVAHGTGDLVTSHDVSRQWFDTQTIKVGARKFKTYDGWSHLLHADLQSNREEFAAGIAGWIFTQI